ncbi:MAG: ATP-binding cassette domain-containing protein [Candidatus Pacebacteria bacterium]|jgi:ABC-type lipoprotein export system ATPase subunit|nr:ATP-binding cassette domain-containing protein [Candidatus Paceibacterota bacterium]MDD4994747.1 ATP-binding cassette domain-containing protein [Candidatus Paceibacterota bacterium]MDD5535369.1 ATP-binding cassette domain-containing protein [Candidatus Paceibacterota bacterium]
MKNYKVNNLKEIKKITIFPGLNKLGQKEKFEKIEINKGEVVAIVGLTGAGKSQLLYDIEKLAQKDTKSKRKVLVNDKIPNRELRFNPEKKLIASLSQGMNFLTDISVKDFLKLHIQARGKKFKIQIIKEIINEANEISGEPISPEMNLLNLSGGQSRALMVADIANISISPIILIDEIENAGIYKEKAIEALIKEGKIVLIVTHDPSLALNATKRLIIKNGGVDKVLETTLKEKGIASYLSWIEDYNLDIREKIRKGERINEVYLFCEPIKSKRES